MFTSISWQQYLQGFLIASAIYYLIIAMIYFRRDVRHWIMGIQSRRSRLRMPITGRTETAESAVMRRADGHASNGESINIGNNKIDSASGDHANQMANE